ncbi:hypothetical protein N7537_005382 [Penicillium hordei]|uniref:Uncharacterized protein n=1 Tax=Penicillium hordei TaxID=40994 RepID=A0AAD6H127_9EURO|nr:uncharacterized protein N7537_005382 [Penicillium hordei]KAJ5602426.1 hypothetical protein N7537_005382 [Penicillium hordei]
MGSTTTTETSTKGRGHVVAEAPTRIMPARKAKSQSKSPTELMSQGSGSQGRKRRKKSDDTVNSKKRRIAQTSQVEAEYVPSANDLICDIPRDENFTIDTLLPDLATSYVDRYTSPAAPARAKRKPWPRQSNPLIDPEKLPPGWSMAEPDLDRDDVDAQIERCHLRIKENIMPHIFSHRLKGLKIAQAERIALVESEPGNHSLGVLRRLEVLRNIEFQLQSSDNFNQLPNVLALLQAYRGGLLHWNIGLVTYWFEGVQLCEPRPFSWDEFEVLNAHHSGKRGFWMEGLVGPGPSHSLVAVGLYGFPPPQGFFARTYLVAIRVPSLGWYAELEFLYDTGACMMSLYEGDLQNIMGRSTEEPTVMGLHASTIADGSTMKADDEMGQSPMSGISRLV